MTATTAAEQICDLDLKGISEALGAGAFSSVEVTEAYLRRIERHDGVLQSYITVTAERALEQARRADAARARGDRHGPLHGVPIAIKDLVAVAGVKMTGGSRVLGDHVPAESAFVARQLDEAGAVLVGKLSMHEFAWGYPTREGPFPTGRNPWNVARVPAGSSSGSGVAVAAGLCAGALGSDTGGSIRGPAANCGIVGLKATYGLVSRAGVLPMCWSLDHVGPMTRTVWDTAVMLQAIAGHDPADASTSAITPPDYTRDLEGGVRGTRLGLPRRYYLDWEGLHADVRSAAVAAFGELERQGARIEEVDIPLLDLLPSIWMPLVAEAFDYHRETLRQRPNEYGDFLRTKLYMAGTFTAQDYLRAQRLRTRLAREAAAVLERVDALVFPGQAVPALSFDEIPQNVIMPQSSRYTAPWNLTGQPAISVPSGFSRDGLPVSIQVVGRPFDEVTVLRIARAYERATSWHTRRPDPTGWVTS
jgi:aspartyl-tRNA(Asn)/glutamyl-tRNA(Gln) amidotransferase subunit A